LVRHGLPIKPTKLGAGMSEQQEQQPVILKIDDQEYDVNELGNDTKVHYVQVVNLRKQLADLQNQIAAAQQQSINLQVALGFRENALRESIQVVEEPEAEVVN
jgi:2-hydroxychromene-2-carboxylate isomerase